MNGGMISGDVVPMCRSSIAVRIARRYEEVASFTVFGQYLPQVPRESTVVAPVARARERYLMGVPGVEECVDRRQQPVGLSRAQGAFTGEDPQTGMVGKLVERDSRHGKAPGWTDDLPVV